MDARKNVSLALKRAALAICAASSLFFWVPLYVVYLSINDINFHTADFFLNSLVITIAASVILFLISTGLSLLRLNWLGTSLLYLILFWSCVAGFMLPVVEQAGMVSAKDLLTNYTHLWLVIGASVALTLLTFTKLKPAAQAFALILTLSTVGTALPSMFGPQVSTARFTSLSSTDNVLVLSFDGLAGNIAKIVLEKDPELKNSLKDFIFYDNAISLAPATAASLRSELYGNINFRSLSKTTAGLPGKLVHDINSIQREQAASADVMTYGGYNFYHQKKSDKMVPGTLEEGSPIERASMAMGLYPYIAARVGTANSAAFIDEQITALRTAYLPQNTRDVKTERALEHKGADWDALTSLQSDDFEIFLNGLHISGNQRTVRYLHLLHTHFPVDFDENCVYRSNDLKWFRSNQNQQGLINETHCALKQTAAVVERLKGLGIYDKTTFVVKSDHGALASYFNDSPDDYMINEHKMWGYNRYRPLLMIKNRDQHADILAYDSVLASLSDLAKTLCIHSPSAKDCNQYKGMDLLTPDAEDSAPILHIDVVKDGKSSFEFDSQITVDVPRKQDFEEALLSTGKVVMAPDMTVFKQRRSDLRAIRKALEKYREANGKYPVSDLYDGLYSQDGRNAEDWIRGLAPTYIKALPRDPENSDQPMPQYLYRSDGNQYKLIAHGPTPSCLEALKINPELVDPMRNCWGFGYWTDGARAW